MGPGFQFDGTRLQKIEGTRQVALNPQPLGSVGNHTTNLTAGPPLPPKIDQLSPNNFCVESKRVQACVLIFAAAYVCLPLEIRSFNKKTNPQSSTTINK
jgi:hypothetical protein